jgi:hypothetical protein
MTNAAFVCACLRLRHDPGAVERVRAGAREIADGWESVASLINDERVAPLLHRTLGTLRIVPEAVAAGLQQSYRVTGIRNLLLLRALGECLRELAAARLPVIVLKGAALAETIYSNVALRPMGDVDLLIHPADLPAMRAVLERLGYRLESAETHPGALAEHENELAFSRPGPIPVFIDVHWSLFDSPHHQSHMDMEWFWQTAEATRIGDVPALMLGPEAQVIHLCGHLGLHHQAQGLLWWHDIAEVLFFYRERMNWAELLARTRHYDLVLPVRTVLARLAEEWDAPVPAEVLATLRAQQPSREERRVVADLTAPVRPAGQRFWSDLASMPGWRRRLRFARTHLFPSVAYMRRRYRITHPVLLPFYYPYRWLRGLRGVRG